MNIEAYDADSLRKMVRLLEYENKILKDKLKKAGISYEEVNPFEEKIESAEEYDLDQGNRIVNPPYITEKMAMRFFSMFWGREDVYARRGKNGGYFPQCANRWNDRLCPKQRKEKVLCDECENTKWISLDVKKIIDHLLGTKEDGSDVIGVYPLLPNGTCRFIVFDFDNHEKGAEVTDFANIQIPRGLRENIIQECEKAGISVEVSDQRETGQPIRVSFKGDLRMQQELAAEKLLSHSDGVLSAATAFGKTVVCSYLIAERKVNTLILLQSKDLLNQWVDELNHFLEIREEPPEYETKTGRKKKRNSVIGVLHGNKNTLTGIIDVAMVGSMYSRGKFNERINYYGMVIMDECHHAASNTSMELLQKINAKYVYGVSATPKRGDSLDRIIYMLLGPLRHRFTALERAKEQGIGHYFVPRYTRVVDTVESKDNINKAYNLISTSKVRNEMIVDDVITCITRKQTPVILTRFKEHAKFLYDALKGKADHVFLLYGDNSDKENTEIRGRLKQVPGSESLVLVATGQKIGEGFDFPRLDVLMLAAPVSFEGRLEQYVGRLNRDYVGKEAVYVYDYIDSHVRYFDKMYAKRLRTYRKTGFSIWTQESQPKQLVNAIFDSVNYTEKFEQDIVESEKMVVISSPDIRQDKIDRFLLLIKKRQEVGVKVTVITTDPEDITYGKSDVCYELIRTMQLVGINVITRTEIEECFAVIDDEIVWHGGMNLLGKADVWDNLMRIRNSQVATELLEIALGCSEERRKSE